MDNEKVLYGFNSSQDVIHLQTKYSLFKRVANILFSTVLDEKLDKEVMTKALNELFKRHDCLRTTFVKKDKQIFQYFDAERTISDIPYCEFKTQKSTEAFLIKFRKKAINCFKHEALKVVFARNPEGKDVIFFKISHYVADTYGIGLLISDLFAVYRALLDGTELPAAPGSFEEVLKKDNLYKANDEAKAKDLEFFTEYYNKQPRYPKYCGIHGNNSDRWLKYKNKGAFYLPYLFVKCDTKGYKLCIPPSLTEKVAAWCEKNNVTMSAFFFYTCSIASSLINDKEQYQEPLMLLDCRGTVAERKAAGTKVQCLSIYTKVDYEKTFNENIADAYADQNQMFRHTKLSYLQLEQIQHKLWNYPMTSQVYGFCYSYIPFNAPKGVTLQILSNGKGSLVTYMALMHNTETGLLDVAYDIQTRMITPEQLMDFHNLYVRVIETVLAKPDEKISKLF